MKTTQLLLPAITLICAGPALADPAYDYSPAPSYGAPVYAPTPALVYTPAPTYALAPAPVPVYAAPSVSRPGPYIGLGGSASFLEDSQIETEGEGGTYSYKTGFGASASLGYNFGLIRTEIEYTFRDNDTDKFDGFDASGSRIESHAFMGNAYLDIPTATIISPYIGGGVGYALIHPQGDNSQGAGAYEGMAGLNFNVDDKTTLYVGYKYFATMNRPKFNEPGDFHYSLNYRDNSAEAGVRFNF